VDRGGDLGLSQVTEVGNLSESCISQKKKLEVKLETAVNSISEKDSRGFLVLQKACLLIRGEKENGNVVKYGVSKDRKNYSMFKTMLWLSLSSFIPLVLDRNILPSAKFTGM